MIYPERQPAMTKQKILFIINPSSGSSLKIKGLIAKHILDTIDRSKYLPEIHHSSGADNITEICTAAVESGIKTIVIAGGDGSVNLVARNLIGTDTALGIIPAGSGNGLARHLKIPVDVKKAVKIINRSKTQLIDSVNINDRVFFSIAGVGFDALVAREYARLGMRGFLSYFKVVTTRYLSYKPQTYELKIDGVSLARKALFVVFANSNQFGYNAIISPQAKPDDGLVDVCITPKIFLLKTPLLALKMFGNTIDKSAYVEIIKARHVEVKRHKDTWINLDGESLELTKDLIIKVNPASLRVIVP